VLKIDWLNYNVWISYSYQDTFYTVFFYMRLHGISVTNA